MHSEDDQIVPYVAAGPLSAKLLKNGTLKTYKDFPHGMPTTQAETINADLLAYYRIVVPMTSIWPDYAGSPRDDLRVEVFETWLERI
jgi:fermentation-respiration switch protein FrsA (DUF1100 family)